MKIAIIGTNSTGKTTLIRQLQEELPNTGQKVIILPEFARLCPFPINEDTTLDAQQWILKTQIGEEAKIDHTNAILVCDRGAIDNFAYFLRAYRLQNRSAEEISQWQKIVLDHTRSYDFIFKTQCLDISAKEDYQRTTNEIFRQEIEQLISGLLNNNCIPHTILPATTNYDEHVGVISKIILNKGIPPLSASWRIGRDDSVITAVSA